MTALTHHSEGNLIRLQLGQNQVLRHLTPEMWHELAPMLEICDHKKEEILLRQGELITHQYFILDGLAERRVSNSEGREMILRFAAEGDMEGAFAAWRLQTPAPFSIVAATNMRVASVPLPAWAAFLDRHSLIREHCELEVMRVMNDVMLHTVSLHLLDGPGRVNRFMRKHPHLLGRLPKNRLAPYLNLAPETLCRLRQNGRIPRIGQRNALALAPVHETTESIPVTE